jgi:hypothetical protein
MTDTAQPIEAAETASDPLAAAADAFKTFNREAPVPERPRDELGRFAPTQEEIEAAETPEGAEATESQDETQVTEEAAEEAQPEAVDLPPSWPSELAEEWQTLPAPVRDKIVTREAEREAAVNAKFQEAANVRKANEALITEANTNAQRFAEASDMVLNLIQPQRPSTSMLIPGSHDYNPDAYHLQNAQADEAERAIQSIQQQRQQAIAQLQKDAESREAQAIAEIEAKTRPLLLKDVPELTDPAKQPAALTSLVQYAVSQGIPEYVFTDPEIARGVTSAQLHITWKAQQYDKMVAAKAQVQPKAQKPAAPVVRPGVATPKSAVEQAKRKQQLERLGREGSIEAGAAVWKNFL